MATYADTLSVRDARDRYLSDNGFNAAYDERWVELAAGPITLRFPNAKGRVRAVKLHDLHHVATGYDTTWAGEAEIAAWELASGCGSFAWAWGLNLSALPIGLVIAPKAMFHAFVRGRYTKNLYALREVDAALLDDPLGTLRARLALDAPAPRSRTSDTIAFSAYCAASLAPVGAVVVLLVWLIG